MSDGFRIKIEKSLNQSDIAKVYGFFDFFRNDGVLVYASPKNVIIRKKGTNKWMGASVKFCKRRGLYKNIGGETPGVRKLSGADFCEDRSTTAETDWAEFFVLIFLFFYGTAPFFQCKELIL